MLYHGTGEKYEGAIEREGLIPKNRLYVHLSADSQTARKVGSRHGKPVIYQVDCQKTASLLNRKMLKSDVDPAIFLSSGLIGGVQQYEKWKEFFDVLYILIAAVICLVFIGKLAGVREGSVIAALPVGNIIKLYIFLGR